jgi:hypothetical protein
MRLNLKIAGIVSIFSILIGGATLAFSGAALAGGTDPCSSPTKTVNYSVSGGLSGDTDIATINVVTNSDKSQTATWPVKDSNYVFCTASGDQTPNGPNPSGDGGTWSITNDQTPDAQFYQGPVDWYLDHIVVTYAQMAPSTPSPSATTSSSPTPTATATATQSASPTSAPTESATPVPVNSATARPLPSATPGTTILSSQPTAAPDQSTPSVAPVPTAIADLSSNGGNSGSGSPSSSGGVPAGDGQRLVPNPIRNAVLGLSILFLMAGCLLLYSFQPKSE